MSWTRVNVTRFVARVFLLFVLALAAPAVALADVSVNTPTDETNSGDSACSLREAILLANGNAEPDCVGTPTTIHVPPGTYTLTAGELAVSPASPVAISGAGASSTIIDANLNGRAFNITSGTVTISGVTVENGRAGPQLQANPGPPCPGGLTVVATGGGILDQGTLTLTDDTFTNNMSAGNGGAVEDSGTSNLSISGSTFTGNNACRVAASALNAFGSGAAVDESGGASVTIDSSTISANAAQGDGGGLAESSSELGALTITNSTISGNQADGEGGGIVGEGNVGSVSLFADLVADNTAHGDGGALGGNDSMSVVNSTIYQNTAATGAGGGIDNGASPVTISFSTINANSAPGGSGGNLANIDSATFTFDDSIITGGTDSGGSPPTNNCFGLGAPSGGYNVFDDISDAGAQCGANGTTDIVSADPKLGPLANNGGPTKTEALQSGSPAIDAANPSPTVCSTETKDSGGNPVDQRGFPRPDGSETQCDIGAFETQDVSVSTVVIDAATNSAWSGGETTGASAYDTATLGGTVSGNPASGTLTYRLFDNGACSGSPASSDVETLQPDGSVPNSAASGGLAPGSYSYQAAYAGNGEYPAATGPCEPFSVARATPSVSTTVFDSSGGAPWSGGETTGASAFDGATVGATVTGFPASGTVSYSFFANGSCSGSPASTDTQTLKADGSVPHSAASGGQAPGSYSYQAAYSGDSDYTAATGPCEPFSVARATPSVSTTVFDAASNSAWSGGEAGAATYDTASLAGTANGFTPSGSVTYSFFDNGSCAGNPASTDAENVNEDGTVPHSSSSGPLAAGSYSYQAGYSGDSNYAAAAGPCEPFSVGPNPDLALSASARKPSILIGNQDTVTDTITSDGGSDATGVQFTDPAAGFTITSTQPSQGSCTHTATHVSCDLGTLAPGVSATVRIVLSTNSAGRITLNSSVSMDQADPTPADNTARTLINVNAPADLSLTAAAARNSITVNKPDTVNDTVTNVGGSDATQVVFTDPAAGFSITSITPSQGVCISDTTDVSCELGTIPAGGRVTLKLVVVGLTPGTFTLRSAVSMATADPTPADNRQSVSIGVHATHPPPPPPHAKGPPFINLVRLGPICRSEHSKIRLAANAHAGAGIRTVTIRLAHHTIYVYRSHPLAPRTKTVVTWVHGSALTAGRTYPVGATVLDVLGRIAHATASFTVCKPPSKRGFTG